ncbi:uncharacterized protein SPPG_09143 [Spizellomyces punctatus DAOM BR117]|uniref:3-oxo-5-alpha-steroid 4-dehydrogenase C-terminal domain-containing protein n=1 Tax=Spizellomyces punctatus (strain DAOM BR117) TaxID=645134 RepID=A0A0L0HGS2_SPIPD|nr:uncharacterized protein SPPG_09143 [Spizellomyces punctatus DAOM BR117]KND00656.1 hypothetical protein SPPG_09143 [Spizellomyces punctatus DAOM BR117]|eukprot:XP_016608695.1 hypothetical protein SPPG_09143 [Spizellomyces punctatus DAOM BR117]
MLLCIVFSLSGVIACYLEWTGRFNAPYSKFRARWSYTTELSSRIGMAIVYGSVVIWVSILYGLFGSFDHPYHIVTYAFYFVNYTKRTLESFFVHRYSSSISKEVVACLTAANLFVATCSCYSILFTKSVDDSDWVVLFFPVPLMIFGLAGNFYHHLLLARLRPKHGKYNVHRPYRIPRGGLFWYTTCPHYFLEIVAWIGFAATVHRPTVYGHVVYICLKLMGRAVQTRLWYLRNVSGYSPDRTALIPFLL